MKKIITVVGLSLFLFGCDSADKVYTKDDIKKDPALYKEMKVKCSDVSYRDKNKQNCENLSRAYMDKQMEMPNIKSSFDLSSPKKEKTVE
uniref:EexN family lipoprotein n=1 Tax=uncultured prokaryote TaxID=198431 RepID=A0A0H5Q8E1_9ZZZZ|nr:hypothetical protein [uncultured prokaryote]